MKNPLTYKMESSLGAVFISLLALFFIGLLFIAIKNFNTDIDIMTVSSNTPNIRKISDSELALVQEWIKINHVEIPEGRGYNYLMRRYPGRPWLD
mgnify:CR=1 FL=1